MNFNNHSALEGYHAYLGASKYHWINYDEEKLSQAYRNHLATERGTRLHELAARLIRERVTLKSSKKTLNMYVNDAIGFGMSPEVILFYSENAFGTADSILFKSNKLRIHDLKTGMNPAKMDQLEVYVAYFCLEYDYKPQDIETELRIYQFDQIFVHNPDPEKINYIIDKVVAFDKLIKEIDSEGV